MRTYVSSPVKIKSFYRKSELEMFLFIPGGHNCTPIWRLHTKLYKGAWNVSATNSETVGHKDLRFGQVVYILVFYNISFSWLLPLDVSFQFIFLLRDSENDLLKAKILTVFLPRFSRLFCLLSSKILQNNLLDLHLVEICRYKLSFYAKTSQILLTTHRHFSTFLKNRCAKLKTRRGLKLGT